MTRRLKKNSLVRHVVSFPIPASVREVRLQWFVGLGDEVPLVFDLQFVDKPVLPESHSVDDLTKCADKIQIDAFTGF